MRNFLFDTNIWEYLFDPKRFSQQHAHIKSRLEGLPDSVHWGISVITWGEIAVGLPENGKIGASVQREHLKFISAMKPWIIGIDTHTAEEYGKLRGRLRANALKRKKGLSEEELIDRFTWLELGSLENDLWVAAQAITRNLTLVTNDKLSQIREVAGTDLHIENWAV